MIKFLLHQEEEVQGRRSRNPSFSKSINPQPVSNRKGGRRSRTASEGDSWTVVSNDNQQRSVHSQGQHLYSGRHSSGSMGTSVANTSNSKTNYGFAKVQPYHKVQAHLVLYNLLRYKYSFENKVFYLLNVSFLLQAHQRRSSTEQTSIATNSTSTSITHENNSKNMAN